MSLPEVLLWQQLRLRPHGLKFRRQHPIGDYVVDFYCAKAKLVVEVDGRHHDGQMDYDAQRDGFLRHNGYAVLRLAATDVLSNLDAVIEQISGTALAARPLHQPAAGPPPRAGEDFFGARGAA
ncbi:endonuclease domain-containing protein [Erythrobacter sp.]|uniref:endonuclease domain-containing protein n=1 Tax=Erythrobacter sp. TaxID=1042 RepID=UPI003C72F590